MLECRLGVKVHLGFYAIDNTPSEVNGKTIKIFEDIKKSIADFLNMSPDDFKIDIRIERNIPSQTSLKDVKTPIIYDIDFYRKYWSRDEGSIKTIKNREFSAILQMRENSAAYHLDRLYNFTENILNDLFKLNNYKFDIYNISAYNDIIDV